MILQYKLKKTFTWVTAISIIITVATSILHFCCNDNVVWSILNNINICIATGCIIGCIQSYIGYASEKHATVLTFYKEAIMLEDAIINYPFMQSGFIESREGLKDIRIIIGRFMDSFKFSHQCIFMGKRKDKVLIATEALYASYAKQIKPFRDMELALYDSLRFMDKTNAELIEEGIDIPAETDRINAKLQLLERKIEQSYNEVESQAMRTKNYKIIEKYLFSANERKSKRNLNL